MDVRVVFVVVRDEKRLGVLHAECFKRLARRLFHLLPVGVSPGSRRARCTQSCSHLVGLGLVERVELHDPAGKLGVGRVLDANAKRRFR